MASETHMQRNARARADAAPGLDWRRILPVLLIVSLDAASAAAILPILPFFLRELGATPLVLGLVLGAEALCQFVAAPWLGQMSDRFGRKRVLMASQAGALASLTLLLSAQSVAFVLLARVLLGLTAANFATAAAYAADTTDPRHRRQAIGVLSAGLGLGGIVGPAVAGALAGISLTAPIWAALALTSASLLCTACWVKGGGRPGDAQAGGDGPALSLLSLAATPVIRVLVAVILCHYLAYGLFSSQLPVFLSETFAWNGHAFGPRELSYILTADGAINILVQLLLLRWLGQRLGERGLIVLVLCGLSVGYVLAGLATGIPALALAVLCISTGVALARPTFLAALSVHVPQSRQGVVMGTAQALVAATDVVSPVLAGLILGQALYGLWLGVVVTIALGGALIALRHLPRQDPETPSPETGGQR